jgi:hypothetical protein
MTTPEQKRRQNRERQQRHRDRKRGRSIQEREEAEFAHRVNVEGLNHRVKEQKCFVGELFPGVDAANVGDALQIAREFARALGIADVQQCETLAEFERRVFEWWADRGGPFLNRQTQQLSPGWGKNYWLDRCGGFDKSWAPLPGSDQVIDTQSLPELR